MRMRTPPADNEAGPAPTASGGTLFERMSNIARGAAKAQGAALGSAVWFTGQAGVVDHVHADTLQRNNEGNRICGIST